MSRGTRFKREKRKARMRFTGNLNRFRELSGQLPEANPPAFDLTVLPLDFSDAKGFEVPEDMVIGVDGHPWVMADQAPAHGEWAIDNFGNAWVPREDGQG